MEGEWGECQPARKRHPPLSPPQGLEQDISAKVYWCDTGARCREAGWVLLNWCDPHETGPQIKEGWDLPLDPKYSLWAKAIRMLFQTAPKSKAKSAPGMPAQAAIATI